MENAMNQLQEADETGVCPRSTCEASRCQFVFAQVSGSELLSKAACDP